MRSGSSRRGVVVTGMGVVCPLGDRADTVFDAMCEGRTVEIGSFPSIGLTLLIDAP